MSDTDIACHDRGNCGGRVGLGGGVGDEEDTLLVRGREGGKRPGRAQCLVLATGRGREVCKTREGMGGTAAICLPAPRDVRSDIAQFNTLMGLEDFELLSEEIEVLRDMGYCLNQVSNCALFAECWTDAASLRAMSGTVSVFAAPECPVLN